jgi:hypothetical protein
MQMRVREQGDEVLIELTGIAGRQQRVLQALTECQRNACGCRQDALRGRAEINVRSGANDMRIRVKGHDGLRFEAAAIYRCLRHALVEQPQEPAVPAVAI